MYALANSRSKSEDVDAFEDARPTKNVRLVTREDDSNGNLNYAELAFSSFQSSRLRSLKGMERK